MRLKELLHLYNDADIINNLVRLYPNENKLHQKAGYRVALGELRRKRARNKGMILVLTKLTDEGEEYVDVGGSDKESSHWGLDFISRSEWLGLNVPEQTIRSFKPLNVLAHAVFEMTWNGFEEKTTMKTRDELNTRAEQVMKDHDKL